MLEVARMIPLPIVAEMPDGLRRDTSYPTASGPELVARLLDEQRSVSAVDRFSQWHHDWAGGTKYRVHSTENGGSQSEYDVRSTNYEVHRTGYAVQSTDDGSRGADDGVRPARYDARYQSLLPATPPAPGQQYAFEVDLDRCSGCKACVVACHTLNGLDENETWRDVGLLIGGSRTAPVMQHVTAACHHCLQPACMIACPVNAYEKDPVTGIVKHLDDQCFGCQYCTMACP
jgi:ferredoxin